MGTETAKGNTESTKSNGENERGNNKPIKKGGESALAIVGGGVGKRSLAKVNPFICRHQTGLRSSTSSSSSCVSSESGKFSGSDNKNAFSGKTSHFEKKSQKSEKRIKNEDSANDSDQDDKDDCKNESSKSSSENSKEVAAVSVTAGKGGVINRLIDKELIRTAIMEHDEDSLPRGIQQGYFKVRN